MILESKSEQLLSLEPRIALLRQQPLFIHWPEHLLATLASKTFMLTMTEGTLIVQENDPITDIYIIAEGVAEVVHLNGKKIPNTKAKIVATLRRGESIGLNQFGLFTTTGVRTASVRASSMVTLLTFHLSDLADLLNTHPELNAKLQADVSNIIRMNFMKQAAPFSSIPYERLHQFMSTIVTREYPAHVSIFHEGDEGDYCCLIIDGKVAIHKKNSAGKNVRVATLMPFAIFGEISPIIHGKRNATANTLTACTLLILSGDTLRALLEQEELIVSAFAKLTLERTYPQKADAIEEFPIEHKNQQPQVILKNTATHRYYQLTEEGLFVWQQFNGSNNIKSITQALYKKFDLFAPELVAELTADLARNGFLNIPSYQHVKAHEKHSVGVRIAHQIQRILEIEYTFKGVNLWLDKSYHGFIYLLFQPIALAIIFFLGGIGIILFFWSTHMMVAQISHTPHLVMTLIIIDFASAIGIFFHELAHAYTTKYFGCTVNQFGVGWYWLGPVAFTDTSDMWRCPKQQRIAVNLAGMINDAFISGIVMLIAWILYPFHPELSLYCWFFTLFAYLCIFENLCPLLEFDGYYTLNDLFNRSNLREDAILWLMNVLPKRSLKHTFSQHYTAEIIYWLSCILFLCLSPALAWFIQHHIIIYIFPSLQNNYLQFLFPVIAFAFSMWSILMQIREKHHKNNVTN